ncbi:MAG: hypothetical protein KGZ42_10040 [Melioribacter sp.]|nr:hypothetical protein [Melioribacter sp.]
MKRFLIILLMLTSCRIYAQVNIDSVLSKLSFVPQDTIKISDLVRKQIAEARLKAESSEIFVEEKPVEDSNKVNIERAAISIPVSNISKEQTNRLFEMFDSLSTNVKIFLSVSVVILILVGFRRILIRVRKNTGNGLKKKIAMIREENVIVKKDRKLSKTRKALRKLKFIENISGNRIELIARELSISKGEILLASKIKKFEYGK